jgi:hypothetical protein
MAKLTVASESVWAEIDSLRKVNAELVQALERITNHESRTSSKHRGYVDVSDLEDLQRIARLALDKARAKV